MLAKTKQQKIKKFYEALKKLQFPPAKEIGLIIVKKENLADISALAPNSNLVSTMELTGQNDAQNFIENLAETLKQGKIALIRLRDYLDPKIYNQLYLLSKNGRMEFPKLEERIFIEAPKESLIILVSTDKELEKLNYKNIFDIVGPVERL